MSDLVKDFVAAVKNESKKTSAYDTPATVTRVDGDTAWVHIPGGVDETPVKLTVNAKAGDSVQLRVGGGRAWITGNASSPPTDDTRADEAHGVALKAEDTASAAQIEAVRAKAAADEAEAMAEAVHDIAEQAQQDADTASTNAQTAITQAQTATAAAQQAQNSLKSVVQGATTVEKAVSVMQTALEAVVDYDPTTDTVQEYFWHDAHGAHVLGDTSGYRNDITSTGMKIVDVSDEEVVSEFSADGATIGKSDGSQSYLYEDYHSLQMIDKEGDIYFHISDLRDKNGRINNEYIGDGATTTFPLFVECLYLYQVMVNDTVVYDYYTHQTSSCSYDDYSFTFLTMTPNVDDVIKVSYLPRYPSSAKAYTLGKTDTSELGGYSLREGVGTEASGYCSHAEGTDTVASGWYSHSEGGRNKASGVCSHAEGGGYRPSASSVQMLANNASGGGSHAEGYGTTASGDFSHAEGNLTTASGKGSHSGGFYTTASGDYSNANGTKTVANYENQFVIGAYNDNKSNNAFEIGNSSSGGFRSNALEVDWQGNVVASGDITDGSGNAFVSFESGTATAGSVTWKYRKWANGELEMWGSVITTLAINTASGNIYTTANEYDVAVPSFVDSVDFLTGEISGGGWVDVTGFNVPPKIRLYAPTAHTSTNRYLRYYLKGSWS